MAAFSPHTDYITTWHMANRSQGLGCLCFSSVGLYPKAGGLIINKLELINCFV
jgi:hypothetical protein